MPSRFELYSTFIFLCAILHTFLTPTFHTLYEKYRLKKTSKPSQVKHYRALSEIFYLLSEVELVFGLWIVPLIIGLFFISETQTVIAFLENVDYTYALYMTVVVSFASTKPIISFAEKILQYVSLLGGNNANSWWWTILTLGPILSFILKEPGAMTISAILLAKTCFPFIQDKKFRYGTLALLLTNISLSGLLTPFTSRSLFLVAMEENWTFSYTFMNFGWKAFVIILLNNFVYYFAFRKKFKKDTSALTDFLKKEKKESPPLWLTLVHLAFLGAIVLSSDYPPLFLGIFFLFLGVHRATFIYQGKGQGPLLLKPAIFVGFFFASILIHGEFQRWWATFLLRNVDFFKGMLLSGFLSSLVDNAVVLYFLDQVKPLTEEALYAIVIGSLSAGGLTLMANAPNLVGYTTLRTFFKEKISLLGLFLAALPLTLLALFIFWLFR